MKPLVIGTAYKLFRSYINSYSRHEFLNPYLALGQELCIFFSPSCLQENVHVLDFCFLKDKLTRVCMFEWILYLIAGYIWA